MASLTVRQLDEKLKKQLRLRAARNGRSVEDEVRTILRSAAADDQQDAFHVCFGRTLRRRSRLGIRRIDEVERLAPGLVGGFAQDAAHLVFHRAAMARGAQTEKLFQTFIELTDGEGSHSETSICQRLSSKMIAMQSLQSKSALRAPAF